MPPKVQKTPLNEEIYNLLIQESTKEFNFDFKLTIKDLFLGSICLRKHEFVKGFSVRKIKNHQCFQCYIEKKSIPKKKLKVKRGMQNSIFQNIYSLYPFDKNTYTLGRLCLRNHDYYNTGYTLRTKLNQICSFCNNIKSAEWSKTEKGKESRKKYRQSESGKLSNKKYKQSELGKISEEKFRKSEKNKIIQIRGQAKRKSRINRFGKLYSKEEKRNRFLFFNNKCVYCTNTKNIVTDHVFPIDLGGIDCLENIVLCCSNCNDNKKIKTLGEWYIKQEFYNKDRFDIILNNINFSLFPRLL